MRSHDPVTIEQKFRELARALNAAGVRTQPTTGRLDSLAIDREHHRLAQPLQIILRRRGAFLFFQVTHVYRVDDLAALVCCVQRIVARVQRGEAPMSAEVVAEFGLRRVDNWLTDELNEEIESYAMHGWRTLARSDLDQAFDLVESATARARELGPAVIFDISAAYEATDPDPEPELTERLLYAMCECTPYGTEWFAHDIGANVVAVNPAQLLGQPLTRSVWMYPILPRENDGENIGYRTQHTAFISRDGSMGIVPSLDRDELMVFGARLIAAVERHRPSLFRAPLRSVGIAPNVP